MLKLKAWIILLKHLVQHVLSLLKPLLNSRSVTKNLNQVNLNSQTPTTFATRKILNPF